jgi:peptidoglycan/xylan/chitin deacetylase (PgdA/CDA1 family)
MAALRGALKRTASMLDAVHPPAPGVVVLIYHRVDGGSGTEVDLDLDVFAAQMDELADRAVTLDRALELMSGAAPGGPEAPVVVTFDDGTADFADQAMPVLAARAIPVTLYLATRFVDEQLPFPDHGRPLSWRSLRDCLTTGFLTVGSHTHSHLLLDRLDTPAVERELDRSIELIREQLGVDPLHFAYPKAVEGSVAARAAVAQRFLSAALAGTRPNPCGSTDRYRLARSPIQVSDGMHWFRRKAAGGLGAEDQLRAKINAIRYRSRAS